MIWLFFTGSAFSQETTTFFSNLSVRDGLPSNIIACIEQDQYDFIWIGTGSGLARYDGYQFQIFKKNQSPKSLPSNELSTLLADGDFLWVGTWHGLCKLNLKTFEVTRIDLGEELAIRALSKSGNNLWIGTGSGLYLYNMDQNTYKRFSSEQHQLSHNTIRSLYQDHTGRLWVGTYDGLNVWDAQESRFETIDLKRTSTAGPDNLLVLDIKPVDSHIWVGTEIGLYKVSIEDYSSVQIQENFSNDVVKCIYQDERSNLWLGTDFGLNIYDPSSGELDVQFHNPKLLYSIANNVIWQIFEDRAGVIWLVTSNGLSRINRGGSFYTYHEVSRLSGQQVIGNQVKTILPNGKDELWLGTQDGVIQVNTSSNERTIYDINSEVSSRLLLNNVFALEKDQLNRIWIGTAGGINIWNTHTKEMSYLTANPSNGLTSNYIAQFAQSPKGDMWVSAWEGGLYEVQGDLQKTEQLKFQPVPDILGPSEKVVFGEEELWKIEFDQLYRIDAKTKEKQYVPAFTEVSGSSMIYSLYYSSSGDVWAGTVNGLIQYNTLSDSCSFHQIITGADVIISSIIEDNSGNIWSTSNTSVHRLSPDDELTIFPLDKDLPLKSFYYGCAAKTQEGHLLFGGDNGYISVDPDQAQPIRFQPEVFITSLQINNSIISPGDELNGRVVLQNNISFTNKIELEYDQRSVTLEFSALHLWQPSMNLYAYQMEGVDKDWNYVSGQKNFAVYSNLAPGSYRFKVRGSNNFGVMSTDEATLDIVIEPPLLLSPVFLIGYMVLAALITLFGLRFYSARVRLRNELQITKLQKEHAEELEQTKEQFFTNISHELRTPISLILPPIHEVQAKGQLDEQSRRLISLAEKNSLRLLKLVNQILDFNKLETETLQLHLSPLDLVAFCREVFDLFSDQAYRHQIDFSFSSEQDEQIVWVDAEKLETVLFNLLSNAVKFTRDGGAIQVNLWVDPEAFGEGAFSIAVKDSGVGISEEDQKRIFDRFYQTKDGRNIDASSGIGLTLAAEYVELHHGEIEVKSVVNEGTTFTVKLPLGKSHLPVDTVSEESINIKATRSVYAYHEGQKAYQLDLDSDKPTILLVEDNRDVIEFIRTSLAHQYNFVTAENGEEGLSKANNFMPELIISDIMMPIMDGLEFCKRIKSNPKTSHITLILLTAKSLDNNKLEGIRHGADVYLTKPFEIPMLEAHITNLIRRKQELTNYFRSEFMTLQEKSDHKDNRDVKFLKKVMDLIEANISEPNFGVEEISKEIGLSATHLYRKVKAQTGHSPQEIIKKYRIKKASLMLKNNEGNVSETMYKVGFSSASYFSKCFKAEFGMTPKEYQNG